MHFCLEYLHTNPELNRKLVHFEDAATYDYARTLVEEKYRSEDKATNET